MKLVWTTHDLGLDFELKLRELRKMKLQKMLEVYEVGLSAAGQVAVLAQLLVALMRRCAG